MTLTEDELRKPLTPDRRCRSCGVPIKFLVNRATGRKIPVDLKAAVYCLEDDGKLTKVDGYYVSHFSTCPQATQHTKKGGGQ